MAKRYLVIGSNSFSGNDFVDLLLADGANKVVGISRGAEPPAFMLRYKTNPNLSGFKFHQMDLNQDTDSILRLVDEFKPERIVNFAAQSEVAPSWANPDHWYQTNVLSLARLIHGLSTRKFIQKYVHISSPEVYGTCHGNILEDAPLNPSTPYAASKAGGDLSILPYIKSAGFPCVYVRATNVYGARQQLFKIIPRSAIYVKKQTPIELHGGGVAVKSYIHIRDVSHAELAIAERGRVGELYHVSPDQGVAVRDVVEKICKLTGTQFSKATKIVEERLGQDAAYTIDSQKLRKELGWKPEISLDQGLREVVDWVDLNWAAIEKQNLSYVHRP